MVVDTMVMDWDTTVLDTGDTTTARGRLRLPPRLRLTPTFLYGGLRTYGYGLGYYGLGHHGVYYGKREAEAAPKAEADPYLRYGGYGLGYGHLGYGYGLGYRGYHWG